MLNIRLLIKEMDNFYLEVERIKGKIEKLNKNRLNCRKGCSFCCVDGITIFDIEAEYILAKCNGLKLKENKNIEYGKCAFLNDKDECLVYEFRPYVCRTQGFPLKWYDIDENDLLVEYRDICPLNSKSKPIELLNENIFEK